MGTGVHLVEGSLRKKMDEPTVFPSSVDGQITRAQLAKIGGNRKCLKNVHVKSEQARYVVVLLLLLLLLLFGFVGFIVVLM